METQIIQVQVQLLVQTPQVPIATNAPNSLIQLSTQDKHSYIIIFTAHSS